MTRLVIMPSFFESLDRILRPHWLKDLWYKFKCWAFKRYSTVKPRSLPHTWCDRSDLMAHMMFEILGQFIEKECPPACVVWYGDGAHKVVVNGEERFVRDEMQELWDWWRKDYLQGVPAAEEHIHEQIEAINARSLVSYTQELPDGTHLWDPVYTNESDKATVNQLCTQLHELERRTTAALNSRLRRLLNIRESMWT